MDCNWISDWVRNVSKKTKSEVSSKEVWGTTQLSSLKNPQGAEALARGTVYILEVRIKWGKTVGSVERLFKSQNSRCAQLPCRARQPAASLSACRSWDTNHSREATLLKGELSGSFHNGCGGSPSLFPCAPRHWKPDFGPPDRRPAIEEICRESDQR